MNAPAYPLLRDAVEHARLAQQAQFWSADAAALFETAGLAAGGRVADLGCGTLHVAQMLNRFVGPAGTVFALDSDAAVLGADPSTGDAARVIVTHGDAYASPWDDGSLDAVHARFLAAPAGRIDALIGEMRRLVRPGGLILMQEPVTHSWHVPCASDEWPRALGLIRAGFAHRGGNLDIGDLLAHVVLAVRGRDIASGLLRLVDSGGHLGSEIGCAQRVHGDADLAVRSLRHAQGASQQRSRQRARRKGFPHRFILHIDWSGRFCVSPVL